MYTRKEYVWYEPKYPLHKLLYNVLWLTKCFINVLYIMRQFMFNVLQLTVHIQLYNAQKQLFVIYKECVVLDCVHYKGVCAV